MKKLTIKALLILLFSGSSFFTASAQKLPNVQTTSLRAPANIKIDGKAIEWNNQFRAYNHATDIFYTVSNDDSKLYLVVRASDKQIINKILRGGVTLTVQTSGKKTNTGGVSITYPLFDRRNTPFVPPVFGLPTGPGHEIHVTPGMPDGLEKLKESQRDSVMMKYNKTLTFAKYIGVTGVKMPDSLISVYNNEGIIAAQSFDNRMNYTCELAIDLKLLGLTVVDAPKFAYRIAVNPFSPFTVPDPTPEKGPMDEIRMPPAGWATTDMWGEYTLAKH